MRESLVQAARTLASGTLANLTGKREYEAIEAIQADFVEFCEETDGRFPTWMQAWRRFGRWFRPTTLRFRRQIAESFRTLPILALAFQCL